MRKKIFIAISVLFVMLVAGLFVYLIKTGKLGSKADFLNPSSVAGVTYSWPTDAANGFGDFALDKTELVGNTIELKKLTGSTGGTTGGTTVVGKFVPTGDAPLPSGAAQVKFDSYTGALSGSPSTKPNWDAVNDSPTFANNSTDYIKSTSTTKQSMDLYNFDSSSIPQGSTISGVKIKTVGMGNVAYTGVLSIGGQNLTGTYLYPDGTVISTWTKLDFSWVKNPSTTQDFTVSDINNLKFGIAGAVPYNKSTSITSVYLEVTYKTPVVVVPVADEKTTILYPTLDAQRQWQPGDSNSNSNTAMVGGTGTPIISNYITNNPSDVTRTDLYFYDSSLIPPSNATITKATIHTTGTGNMQYTGVIQVDGAVSENLFPTPVDTDSVTMTSSDFSWPYTDPLSGSVKPVPFTMANINQMTFGVKTRGSATPSKVHQVNLEITYTVPGSGTGVTYETSGTADLKNFNFNGAGGATGVRLLGATIDADYKGQQINMMYSSNGGQNWVTDIKLLGVVTDLTVMAALTTNDQTVTPVLRSVSINYVVPTKPLAPVLVSPISGALATQPVALTITNSFSDDDGGNFNGIHWVISGQNDFSGAPVAEFSTNATQSQTVATVTSTLPVGTYYWRAAYLDSDDDSRDSDTTTLVWSNTASFTIPLLQTRPTQPDKPVDMTPTDGAPSITGSEVNLIATPIAPATQTPQASKWEVLNSLTGPVIGGGSTTYTPDATNARSLTTGINSCTLADSTSTAISSLNVCVIKLNAPFDPAVRYYWRVQYQNTDNLWSDWSDPYFFTTTNNVTTCSPDEPTLVGPSTATPVYVLRPKLTASAFGTTCNDPLTMFFTQADWELSTNANLTQPMTGTSTAVTAGQPIFYDWPTDLVAGTKYYWRVTYKDNGQRTAQSQTFSFTVDPSAGKPPVKPTNISPLAPNNIFPSTQTSVTVEASAFNQPNMATHSSSTWVLYQVVNGQYTNRQQFTDTYNATTHVLTGLTAGTYAWTVNYTDLDSRVSDSSTQTEFTINPPCVLDKPTAVSPVNNATAQLTSLVITASPFSPACSTHASSAWQLTDDVTFNTFPGFPQNTAAVNTYSVTGLTPGVKYYWRVTYTDSNGARATSDTWSFTVAPATRAVLNAPTEVKLESPTLDGFTVNWVNNAPTATGFKVYTAPGAPVCSLANYSAQPDSTLTTPVTSQVITGKTANTQYCAKVIATLGATESLPAFSTLPKYTLIETPTGINFATKTDVTIVLSATSATGSFTNLDKDDSGLYFESTPAGNTGALGWTKSIDVTDYNLNSNELYTYYVKARNGDRIETALSSSFSITTLAATPSLTVVGDYNETDGYFFTVTIDPKQTPANALYTLDYMNRDTATGGAPINAFSLQSTTTYILKNFYTETGDNRPMTFSVKATNIAGDETAANTADGITPPGAPDVPKALISKDVTLSWEAELNAAKYYVEYSTDPAMKTVVKTLTPTTNKVTITGLPANTVYYWRVKSIGSAVLGSKAGAFTSINTFTSSSCVAAVPTNFRGRLSSGGNKIYWTWTKISGRFRYIVKDRLGISLKTTTMNVDNFTEDTLANENLGNRLITRYVDVDRNSVCGNSSTPASVYTFAKVPESPTVNYYSDSQVKISLRDYKNTPETTYMIKVDNQIVQLDGSRSNNPAWATQSDWLKGTNKNGVIVGGFSSSQRNPHKIEVIARNSANIATSPATVSYRFAIEPVQYSLRAQNNITSGVIYEKGELKDGKPLYETEKYYFIELSRPVDTDLSFDVDYSGTATIDKDYTVKTSKTQKIAKGVTGSAVFSVAAMPDNFYEEDETVDMKIISISDSTKAVPSTNISSKVTIMNSNSMPKVTALEIGKEHLSQVIANEKTTLTVKIDQTSAVDSEIDLGFFGTAIVGVDYILPRTIIIRAGKLFATETLTVNQTTIALEKSFKIQNIGARHAIFNNNLAVNGIMDSALDYKGPSFVKVDPGATTDAIKVTWDDTNDGTTPPDEAGFIVRVLVNPIDDCDKSVYTVAQVVEKTTGVTTAMIGGFQPGAKLCVKVTAKYSSTGGTFTESRAAYSIPFYTQVMTPSIDGMTSGYNEDPQMGSVDYFIKIRINPGQNSDYSSYEARYKLDGIFATEPKWSKESTKRPLDDDYSMVINSLSSDASPSVKMALKPNTKYLVQVRAIGGGQTRIESAWSQEKSMTTPPDAPKFIKITNMCGDASIWLLDNGKMTASWSPSEAATSYQIEYGKKINGKMINKAATSSPRVFNRPATTNPNTLLYEFSGLAKGDNYVRIAGVNANGQGPFSVEDKANNINSSWFGSCSHPLAATNFRGEAVSTSEIKWLWDVHAGGAVKYALHGMSDIVLLAGIQKPVPAIGGIFSESFATTQKENLLANTAYTRHINVEGDQNPGITNDSNIATVYTLAGIPSLTLKNGAATGSVNIVLNKGQYNPDYTKYAIKMAALPGSTPGIMNAWLRPDGTTVATEFWATSTEWNGATGFDIKNLGLPTATTYYFTAKARNNSITPIETALSREESIVIPADTDPNKSLIYSKMSGSVTAGAPRQLLPTSMLVTTGETGSIKVYAPGDYFLSFVDCAYDKTLPVGPAESVCAPTGTLWKMVTKNTDSISEFKVTADGKNHLVYWKYEKAYRYKINIIGDGTVTIDETFTSGAIKPPLNNPSATNEFFMSTARGAKFKFKIVPTPGRGMVIDKVSAPAGCFSIDRDPGFTSTNQALLAAAYRNGMTFDFRLLRESCEIDVVFKKNILTIKSKQETKTPPGLPFWNKIGSWISNALLDASVQTDFKKLAAEQIGLLFGAKGPVAQKTQEEFFNVLATDKYDFSQFFLKSGNLPLIDAINTGVKGLGESLSGTLAGINDIIKPLQENAPTIIACNNQANLTTPPTNPIPQATCDAATIAFNNADSDLYDQYKFRYNPALGGAAPQCNYGDEHTVVMLFILGFDTAQYETCFDNYCSDSGASTNSACNIRKGSKDISKYTAEHLSLLNSIAKIAKYKTDLLALVYEKGWVSTGLIPGLKHYNDANYYSSWFQNMAAKVQLLLTVNPSQMPVLATNTARADAMKTIDAENNSNSNKYNKKRYGVTVPISKWIYEQPANNKSVFNITANQSNGFVITDIEESNLQSPPVTRALAAQVEARIKLDMTTKPANTQSLANAFVTGVAATPTEDIEVCSLCKVMDMEQIIKDLVVVQSIKDAINAKLTLSSGAPAEFKRVDIDGKNYKLEYKIIGQNRSLYKIVSRNKVEDAIAKSVTVTFLSGTGKNDLAINEYDATAATLQLDNITNNQEIKVYYSFMGKIGKLFDVAFTTVFQRIAQDVFTPLMNSFSDIYNNLILNKNGGRGAEIVKWVGNAVQAGLGGLDIMLSGGAASQIFAAIGGEIKTLIIFTGNKIAGSDISALGYWALQ